MLPPRPCMAQEGDGSPGARARPGAPAVGAPAAVAPAVRRARLSRVFTEVIGRLPRLPIILGKGARGVAVAAAGGDEPAKPPDGSYQAIPWNWGRELRLLGEEALADARRVEAPAILL